MKRSLILTALLGITAMHMSDPADSASAAPLEPDPQPAAPVTVTVPAEHADLLQRAVALLEKGEQWVKDNIEAGVTTLENMFKSDDA